MAVGLACWAVLARATGDAPGSAVSAPTHTHASPPSSTTSTRPPTTTTRFAPDAALRSAEAFVQQQGYTVEGLTDFREQFNAIGAVRKTATTDVLRSQESRVFFFVGDRAVGTDTTRDGDIRESVARSESAISVEYDNYQGQGSPIGPPGYVRFIWDGNTIKPLDPFPAFVQR